MITVDLASLRLRSTFAILFVTPITSVVSILVLAVAFAFAVIVPFLLNPVIMFWMILVHKVLRFAAVSDYFLIVTTFE